MTSPMKAGATAIAVAALGLALAGCGSDTKAAPSSSSASSSSESSSTTKPSSSSAAPATPAAGKNETIADYIKENGITETPVKQGDPGTPTIDLPVPAGWQDAGAKTPAVRLGRHRLHRSGHGRRSAVDRCADVEADRERRSGKGHGVRAR